MSPKRYYVLTAQGELGPHTRLELRELLRARKVHADDQLRTALGKTVGTVGSMIADAEEVSSYRTPAVEVDDGLGDEALSRRPVRDHEAVHASPLPWWRPVFLAVGGVGAIITAWLLVKFVSHDASQLVINPVAERQLPVLSVSGRPGSWSMGEPGVVILRLSQPSPVSLTVPITWGGTAIPGVDVEVLAGQIIVPSDTYAVEIPVPPLPASLGRAPAVQVTARLQGGSDWLLDPKPEVSITLRSRREQLATDPVIVLVSELPFVSEWNRHYPVSRDQGHNHNPIEVGGIAYPHGLGVHPGNSAVDPVAHVTVRLAGAYDVFLTDIGLHSGAPPASGAIFQVWVDGKPQFDSGLIKPTDKPRTVRIPVSGAGELKLIVLDGGESAAGFHASWAGARLLKRP